MDSIVTEKSIYIRWMLWRDMQEVLALENTSFEFPWLEEDFVRCLRQRNCIGMVAEHENQVVGFMVYELQKRCIHLLNFAVDRRSRRQGIGTQLLQRLIEKLSGSRRNRIVLEVRETNLDAQLFFRANGFRAVAVLRGFYDNSADDAYVMERFH